jgi:adenine-specific DNA-methyltransferase
MHSQHLLDVDDVRGLTNPDNLVSLFQKLGYTTSSQALALSVKDLELPAKSEAAIESCYLIADHTTGIESLQVLLFQLGPEEVAIERMRSIAKSLSRSASDFLLIGTRDFNQMLLINPRQRLDENMCLRFSCRTLLIDRTKPAIARARLEALAAKDLAPMAIYQAECKAFD